MHAHSVVSNSDCSSPGSSVSGILQARILGLPCPPPGDLPDSGIELASPAVAGGFFTTEPLGKPQHELSVESKLGGGGGGAGNDGNDFHEDQDICMTSLTSCLLH